MREADTPGYITLDRGIVEVDFLNALSGISLTNGEYRNALLSVSFTKPTSWYYLAYRDFLRAGEPSAGYESHRELVESQGTPLVVIAKYRETPPDFSPSVVLYAEADDEADPTDLLALDLESFGAGLQEFSLESPPAPHELAGHPGSRSVYTYTHVGESGRKGLLRTELLSTARHGIVYSLNLTSVLDPPDLATRELGLVGRSFRLLDAHAAS